MKNPKRNEIEADLNQKLFKGYDPEYFKRYSVEKRRCDCACSNCDAKFKTLNALKQHEDRKRNCLIKKLVQHIKDLTELNDESSDSINTPEIGTIIVMESESERKFNHVADERMVF